MDGSDSELDLSGERLGSEVVEISEGNVQFHLAPFFSALSKQRIYLVKNIEWEGGANVAYGGFLDTQ